MFEYVKTRYNGMIEELNDECSYQKREIDIIDKKVISIEKFKELRSILKSVKTINTISLVAFITFLVMFTATFNLLPITGAILSLIITRYSKIIKEQYQKEINKEYTETIQELIETENDTKIKKEEKHNYKSTNDELLDKVVNALTIQKNEKTNRINELEEKTETLEFAMWCLKNYEFTENTIRNARQEPLKYVKTEEEYNEFLKQYEIFENNSLESFLQEKPNYTYVKSYNELDGEIIYKEKPKQFIKKR